MWDVALTKRSNGQVGLMLPTNLGRELIGKGYNRARVTLTEQGIVLVPYIEAPEARKTALPKSWS